MTKAATTATAYAWGARWFESGGRRFRGHGSFHMFLLEFWQEHRAVRDSPNRSPNAFRLARPTPRHARPLHWASGNSPQLKESGIADGPPAAGGNPATRARIAPL
jgi:hypothetical protein